MASYTPVSVYMDMTIPMFHDFRHAIREVLESRKKK